MVSGKHPIAGRRQLTQAGVMTLIRRYPLGPHKQALLAALLGSPQPLLTDKTSIAGKLGTSDEPVEPSDFEEPPNRGMVD